MSYKGSLLNELAFRLFVRYKGPISLANIIHGRPLFPELKQLDVSGLALSRWLKHFATNRTAYDAVREELKKTSQYLSGDSFDIAEYMSYVIKGQQR